jgi:hypothetical protein
MKDTAEGQLTSCLGASLGEDCCTGSIWASTHEPGIFFRLQVVALGHPVIAIEMNTVALRLSTVQTADEVLDGVLEVMERLRVKKACVVGHSYGAHLLVTLSTAKEPAAEGLCMMFQPYPVGPVDHQRHAWPTQILHVMSTMSNRCRLCCHPCCHRWPACILRL